MDDGRVSVGGVDLPAVGLGTWRLRGADCRRAVASLDGAHGGDGDRAGSPAQ